MKNKVFERLNKTFVEDYYKKILDLSVKLEPLIRDGWTEGQVYALFLFMEKNQDKVKGKTIEIPLKKGENDIVLWLSNKMGLTRGTWVFSFSAITQEGEILRPQLF